MKVIIFFIALLLSISRACAEDSITVFFRAEPASFFGADFGHASVQIRGVLHGKVFFEAWGFRPSSTLPDGSLIPDGLYGFALQIFGSPSQVTPDHDGEIYIAVPISEEQLNGIHILVEDWSKKGLEFEAPSYGLLVRNCVTFADAIARYVGLVTPPFPTYLYPDWYMRGLQILNPKFRRLGLPPKPSSQGDLDAASARDQAEHSIFSPGDANRIYSRETRDRAAQWNQFRTQRDHSIAAAANAIERRRSDDLEETRVADEQAARDQVTYNADDLRRDQILLNQDLGYPPAGGDVIIPVGGTPPTFSMCPEQFVCAGNTGLDMRRARPDLQLRQGTLPANPSTMTFPPAGLVRLELNGEHSWSANNTLDFGLVPPGKTAITTSMQIRVGESGAFGLFIRGSKLKVDWGSPPTENVPKHVRTLKKSESYTLNITMDAHNSDDNSQQYFFITYRGRIVSTIVVDYFALKMANIELPIRIRGLVSALGERYSTPYSVCSGPAPLGFTLDGKPEFSVGGDERPRSCASWAICKPVTQDDDDVCYTASIQGHQGDSVGDESVVHAQALLVARYKFKKIVPKLLLVDDQRTVDPG